MTHIPRLKEFILFVILLIIANNNFSSRENLEQNS